MAIAPKFDEGLYDAEQPPKQSSGWKTCFITCLGVCVVLAVLAILLFFWVSRNWRSIAANFGSQVVNQIIDESDLPPQEKAEMKVQVDRVAAAFREGRLSDERMQVLIERLVQSPLMTSLVVAVVETKYLDKSGLSEEEKAAGRQTLQRFVRGAIDETIPQAAIESVADHIGTRGPNGEFELKENVTDDELRAFLAAAKTEADKAGVVDQPESVDPSDEFKRIIDEALSEPAAEPVAEPVAEPPPLQ